MADPSRPASFVPLPRAAWFRYGVAAAAVSVAATANLAIRRYLPATQPHQLFPTAIVVAGLLGGAGAGVFATLLAALLRVYVLDTLPLAAEGGVAGMRLAFILSEGVVLSLVAADLPWAGRLRARTWPVRWGTALVGVAAVLAVKLLFFDAASRLYPFVFLYAAVAIAARTGGIGPGLTAAGLVAAAADWFWLNPGNGFDLSAVVAGKLVMFTADVVLIALVCTRIGPAWRPAARTAPPAPADRLHRLLQAVRDHAVIQLDTAGRVATWNAGAERILGCREPNAVGRPFADFAAAEDRAADRALAELQEAARTGRSERTGWRERADGTRFWAETVITAGGDGTGYAVVLRDVSARRQAEEASRLVDEKVRQAQRLEAVGRLAGGIAHDFNNLLTVILGNLDLVLEHHVTPEKAPGLLEDVRDAGRRAAVLTRQLLSFSRRQPVEPKRIDVNAIVTDIGSLLRRTIAENITLETDLRPGIGPVLADPGQLEQVILNLVVNAKDAMPQGGTLTIRTNEVDLSAAELPADADGPPGRYVILAMTDTGHGMDDATKARIFEPFFTTKEIGKGTGLGLATVYGNVKQANGWVAVDSRPAAGSTFRVFLPRATGSVDAEIGAKPSANGVGGSETILLVEDEPPVRTLAKLTLEAAGYTVLACPDGKAAMEAARHFTGAINLVVTDLIMPYVNGRQLAEALKQDRPDVRVLFMSGYTESAVANLGPLASEEDLLDKPFVPGDLTRKVREMLDRTA